MKRAIAIFLALCVLCLTTGATWQTVLTGSVASGTTYSLQETFGANTANGSTMQSSSSRTYVVSICTPGASYTITRVDLRMFRTGTGAATLTARIYSDSSTTPATLLASSTNTVDSADVSTTESWVTFYFAGQAVTSGTPIWIGVSGATTDASNYYTFRGAATSTGTIDSSSNGSAWSGLSTRAWYIQTYVSP